MPGLSLITRPIMLDPDRDVDRKWGFPFPGKKESTKNPAAAIDDPDPLSLPVDSVSFSLNAGLRSAIGREILPDVQAWDLLEF